jgi:hypothetical protein
MYFSKTLSQNFRTLHKAMHFGFYLASSIGRPEIISKQVIEEI